MIVFYICISNVLINEIYYNHFMYVDVLFPLVGVHNCVNSAFIHLTNGKKKDPPIQRLISQLWLQLNSSLNCYQTSPIVAHS